METIKSIDVDALREEHLMYQDKLQKQINYTEKYVESVHEDIQDCKNYTKKYAIDMLVVVEEAKTFMRQSKSLLEENGFSIGNVAKMCLTLTECLLIQ